MTVAQLLRELTVDELIEWQAYSRIEPFGFEIENFRAGVVAATVANVAPRKGGKALKPSDFYPVVGQRSGLTERQERELAERRARRKER